MIALTLASAPSCFGVHVGPRRCPASCSRSLFGTAGFAALGIGVVR